VGVHTSLCGAWNALTSVLWRERQLDKEASFVVRKTGGDLCQLESDELCFTPELLLVRRGSGKRVLVRGLMPTG
jgi:hypothetical protein